MSMTTCVLPWQPVRLAMGFQSKAMGCHSMPHGLLSAWCCDGNPQQYPDSNVVKSHAMDSPWNAVKFAVGCN